MSDVTMKQLLEAGVHFGHQTRRWNPKMEPYIFGERNGIHIIDLRQTLEEIKRAHVFVRDIVAKGGFVLFVGTKKQAQPAILEAARRADMPYVNFRWLGGMLTNFKTITKRIFYMKELAQMEESGDMDQLPKKERLRLRREFVKLDRTLGGVSEMERTPSVVFIVDLNAEHIAVKEAIRLNIPVIALVDSNCDPDFIDFVIPGNDDAIRAASLIANAVAAACVEGRELARLNAKEASEETGEDTAGDTVEDAAKDTAKNTVEDAAKDTAGDAAEDRAGDTVADSPEDAAANTGEVVAPVETSGT